MGFVGSPGGRNSQVGWWLGDPWLELACCFLNKDTWNKRAKVMQKCFTMSKLGDVLFGCFSFSEKKHVFSGGFDAWKNVAKAGSGGPCHTPSVFA